MGNKYRSPAKVTRSLRRLLEYKKAQLEDIWDCDVSINAEKSDLVWNVSTCLKLTLLPKTDIFKTDQFTNSTYLSLTFGEKLMNFQNMWKPDANSTTFFSCLHNHLRRNSSKCDTFCARLSSSYCGKLAYFLSTNNWPD